MGRRFQVAIPWLAVVGLVLTTASRCTAADWKDLYDEAVRLNKMGRKPDALKMVAESIRAEQVVNSDPRFPKKGTRSNDHASLSRLLAAEIHASQRNAQGAASAARACIRDKNPGFSRSRLRDARTILAIWSIEDLSRSIADSRKWSATFDRPRLENNLKTAFVDFELAIALYLEEEGGETDETVRFRKQVIQRYQKLHRAVRSLVKKTTKADRAAIGILTADVAKTIADMQREYRAAQAALKQSSSP